MKRKQFLQNTSFILAGFSIAGRKPADFFLMEDWKITMITDRIGFFTERGGTIGFLLSNTGIVVVDSQFPDQSKHLIEELKKRSERPFKLLINSHHHGDHTAGNISFKGITEHVLAHENSKKNQEAVATRNNSMDKQLLPDQTFSDTWCQSFDKEKICLYYYGPAHTDGDSVIHFEHANIVHMGDLMFNRRHPFVDRSAGANISSWIRVLEKTINKFDSKTKFIFGHAAENYDVTGTAEDLKKFGDYLGRLLVFTEKEIKSGKSREEVLKNTSLPGETEWVGDGFSRPLTAAYEELTEKKGV